MQNILSKLGSMLLVVLLLILLLWSGYQSFTHWNLYNDYKKVKYELINTKFIQSLEHALFNEMLCTLTLKEYEGNFEKICMNMEHTTDSIIAQIKKGDFDSDLYALKNNVQQIRSEMKKNHYYIIEGIKKRKLEKEIHQYVQKYLNRIGSLLHESKEKRRLELYRIFLDTTFEFETEKVLLAYYLSGKQPMKPEDLIVWDQIVNSQLSIDSDAFNENRDLINYNQLEVEKVQKVIRQIEDVRLDVMTHASKGIYKTSLIDWIRLSNEYQTVLIGMEDKILTDFMKEIDKKSEIILTYTIVYGLIFLLSFLSILFYIYLRTRETKENKYYSYMIKKITTLNNEKGNIVPYDKKLVYNYIENSYEKLYTENQKIKEELQKKDMFFTKLLYDIKFPLEGINGFAVLLKEAPLSSDQKEYIDEINNSSQAILKMIEASPTKFKLGVVDEYEPQENSINIIRKTELLVEQFTPTISQKDIHMSLYTDPSLDQYLYIDDINLSKVLTFLIDQAIRRTHIYGNINIYLEKKHENDEDITIRYNIVDNGKNLSDREVERLNSIINADDMNLENVSDQEEMLSITNKILIKHGSKLEFTSTPEHGNSFSFKVRLLKDLSRKTIPSLQFENISIGIALPSINVIRQEEKNIKAYANALGATLSIYDYDQIIKYTENDSKLPDVMIVYHRYARLQGELDMFTKLDSNVVLVTTPVLRASINPAKYCFSSILYEPVTYHKIVRILAQTKMKTTNSLEDEIEREDEIINEKGIDEDHTFGDLTILLVEDNLIQEKLLVEKLTKLGLENIKCTNDAKALFKERIESNLDIILMDVDIFEKNGVDVFNKLLYYERVNQLQHVPIIAIIADQRDREKYLKLGFDDVLSKNASEEDIHLMIQQYGIEILRMRADEDENALIAKMLSGDLF